MNPVELYHFSEQPDIALFEPRKLDSRPDELAMVWAIDAFHAPHYYLPRDCPRVCIWPSANTSEFDLQRFWGHSGTTRTIVIESGWLDRVRRTFLYRYTFEPGPFALYDANAGYYTATSSVRPVSAERMDDLLGSIVAAGIELRITPSLMPLHDAIVSSAVQFSMIRMRNAGQI